MSSLIFCNTTYSIPSNTGLLFIHFQIQIFMEANSTASRPRGKRRKGREKKRGREGRQTVKQASSVNGYGRN